MKNKLSITLFLLLVTMAVTVFLFFYWTAEDKRTTLFMFNLGYTLFLEILFYGFIYFTRLGSKKLMGSIYAVLGTVLFFYLLFGFISLLAFNILLLEVVSLKWYYTWIVLGTLGGIIATGFTLKLNSNLMDMENETKQGADMLSGFIQKLKYLEKKYGNLLAEKGLSESFESSYASSISKLLHKITFINPKMLENKAVTEKIKNAIYGIEDAIEEMNAPDAEGKAVQKRISALTDDTLFYLNSLKN